MNHSLNPLIALPEFYDRYAGALLSACYSLTHDQSKAEQALVNTFVCVAKKPLSIDSYSNLFRKLYRQARRECILLMDEDPSYSHPVLSQLERVVAELIYVRKYSVAITAKLLNRDTAAIKSIAEGIKQNQVNARTSFTTCL